MQRLYDLYDQMLVRKFHIKWLREIGMRTPATKLCDKELVDLQIEHNRLRRQKLREQRLRMGGVLVEVRDWSHAWVVYEWMFVAPKPALADEICRTLKSLLGDLLITLVELNPQLQSRNGGRRRKQKVVDSFTPNKHGRSDSKLSKPRNSDELETHSFAVVVKRAHSFTYFDPFTRAWWASECEADQVASLLFRSRSVTYTRRVLEQELYWWRLVGASVEAYCNESLFNSLFASAYKSFMNTSKRLQSLASIPVSQILDNFDQVKSLF